MSTLQSPVKSIGELRIHRLPAGRKVAVTHAIRYDGQTFIVGLDGKVYSNRAMDHAFYQLSDYGWATAMVRALAKIGMIKGKDAEAHIEAARRADKARENRSVAASFEVDAKNLGVKLTAKQRRLINKWK